MSKEYYAEKRLRLLRGELGEVQRVFTYQSKIYLEFSNGMNIQLHDDEIVYQAKEYLSSELQNVTEV